MTRPGSLDRADSESHEDYPDRPLPDGVTTSRYSTESLYQDDKLPSVDVPYEPGIFDRYRKRRKVRRGMWTPHLNGAWCKRCGSDASCEDAQIAHQDHHAREDRRDAQLEADRDEILSQIEHLRDWYGGLDRRARDHQLTTDALLMATGNTTDDALQRVVDRVIGYANDATKARKEAEQ